MNRTNARRSVPSFPGLEMQSYGHVDLNEVDPTSPWYKPRSRNIGQALFGHPPQELLNSDDERSSSSYSTHHLGTASVKELLMMTMEDSSCLDELPDEQAQISLLLDLVAKDEDDYDTSDGFSEDVVEHQEPVVESHPELKDDPEDFIEEEVVEDQPLSMQDEIVEEEPIITKPSSPIRTPVKKTASSLKPKTTSATETSKKRRPVIAKKTNVSSKSQTSE